MTTAERLTAVAENVQKVYEAGFNAARVPVEEKDVNFYDYDGTLLYSYTVAEAQALTELPPLPTQPGLICQEWNWDLDAVKALDRPMDVGATYITDDGATRLRISFVSDVHKTLTLYFWQSVASGVSVNWGDGITETIDTANNVQVSHEYSAIGEFVISITPMDGCTLRLGHSAAQPVCNLTDMSTLKSINLGKNIEYFTGNLFKDACLLETVTIPSIDTFMDGVGTFAYCDSLKALIVPKSIFAVSGQCVRNAKNLKVLSLSSRLNCSFGTHIAYQVNGMKRLCLPNGLTRVPNYVVASSSVCEVYMPSTVTALGTYAFYELRGVRRISLSEELTTIEQNSLNFISFLVELTIPSKVTSIAAGAFANNNRVERLRFLSNTPPSVANANAFSGIPATCVVEVPVASLDAYKNATNYGSIAAQMVGV